MITGVTALAAIALLAVTSPGGAAAGADAHGSPLRAAASDHPIHTSLTRIQFDGRGGVTIRLRTFADDFAAAVTRATGAQAGADHLVPAPAAERYVVERLVLSGAGRRLPLRLVSQRRDGDVTWLELTTSGLLSITGLKMENRLLAEFHADQVNVVQLVDSGGTRTVLFTAGDAAKVIR